MFRSVCRLLTSVNGQNGTLKIVPAMGYKSQYSLEKLYPNSNPDFLRSPFATCFKSPKAEPEEFDGYIPIDSLDIKYSKSSGPGGQHVNKVNSKVEVRVHVASSEWIPAKAKEKLLETQRNRINKEGYLVLTSQKTRKQILNQADCLDKLRSVVRAASKKDYQPSEEEIQLKNERMAKIKRLVLKEKRDHSLKKQHRSI